MAHGDGDGLMGWWTATATAFVMLLGLAGGTWPAGSPGTVAHGAWAAAAEEPAPARKVRTLRWRETTVNPNETLTHDVWLDVERGFHRERYRGTLRRPAGDANAGRLLNDGETFRDDAFVTVIYHGERNVHHWRANPLNALAHARKAPNDLPGRMRVPDPAKLAGVTWTRRQERVSEIECDVWEGRFPLGDDRHTERSAKFWMHPALGLPMRIEFKDTRPRGGKPTGWTLEIVEIDPTLPPNHFRAPPEPPKGYTTSGPRERAAMAGV
jgi:hypothetical protein